MIGRFLFFCIGLSLCGAASMAATFPPDEAWTPLTIGGAALWDVVGDASPERDLVGDMNVAVAFIAHDLENLFLRIRLDISPIQSGSTLKPFAWGMEFDTDANLDGYEYLLMADGISNPDILTFHRNTIQGSVGDPNDNSEDTIQTYGAVDRMRVVAAGTVFSDTPDYFLDLAFPLADLQANGIDAGMTAAVVVGSSNNALSLTNDLASPYGATTLSDIFSDRVVLVPTVTNVGQDMANQNPALWNSYPNPFNPQTTIAFEIPSQQDVALRVFDLSGRLVRNLIAGETRTPGRHEVVWNGRDDSGRQVASGTYFYRLAAGDFAETKRMVLVK